MPADTLRGLTADDFIAGATPVFQYWLSSWMKNLSKNAAFNWIEFVYRRKSDIGASIAKWGNLPSMERWRNRRETENFPQVQLPIPDYLVQYFEQFAAEFAISQEYFEKRDLFDKLDPTAEEYTRTLAQSALDTRAGLAFLPFADGFTGTFWTDPGGIPLFGTHVTPMGNVTNATNLELSPEGLDLATLMMEQVFTEHGMPLTYNWDLLMVGDALWDTANDIISATGEYEGLAHHRNKYANLTPFKNPFLRDAILTNGSTMWVLMSSEQLAFDEIWALEPKIDIYREMRNLTHQVRGRMEVLHNWSTYHGAFGSTGTVSVS